MTTDLAKIQGYVPQEVYQKLLEFKDQRDLKSVSMAVTAALEELFGLEKSNLSVNYGELVSQVETHEAKIASLNEQLTQLSQALESLSTNLTSHNSPVALDKTAVQPGLEQSPILIQGYSGSLVNHHESPSIAEESPILIQARSDSLVNQYESPNIAEVGPLSGRALGNRLVSGSEASIRKHRAEGDLEAWTRDRDPDGLSWSYSAQTKLYYPSSEAQKLA